MTKNKVTKLVVGISDEEEIKKLFEDIEKNQNKRFDNHIIAYLDFLGVKEKIENNPYESLQIIRFILEKAKDDARFIKRINSIDDFNIKLFSDNIVITQKVDQEIIGDQIISVINLVCLIQFEALFQFDFPLRGGITIGELYIDDSIVWGTGLINSYKMENKLAIFPRVVVSQELLNIYDNYKQKTLNIYALIEKDFDGLWFADYMLTAPSLSNIPILSEALKEKAKEYKNKGIREQQKYNWIISKFNSMCVKFKDRGDYEKYVLPLVGSND